MKNSWLKKNPLLSMWLSAANAAAGYARGRATMAAKRQTRAAVTKSTKQMTDLWFGALTPPAPKKKRKRR